MTSTNNQTRGQAAPLQLMEPDLAAWAEKITIGSTNDRRGLWYGAALFWIVVIRIASARIAFLDPSRIQLSWHLRRPNAGRRIKRCARENCNPAFRLISPTVHHLINLARAGRMPI